MKKITALFLILILVLPFTACGKGEKADYSESLLAGFETQAEIESISPFFTAGAKISLNTDKDYVAEGGASMFIEYYGTDTLSMLPNFFKHSNSLVFYQKAGDFITRSNDYSNAMSIAVDIYNDSGRDIGAWMDIRLESGAVMQLDRQLLLDGRFNTCIFEIDYLKAGYLGIQKVETFTLYFDNASAGQTAKLYVDNVRTRDYKKLPKDKLTLPALAGNEICFFEDDYIFKTLSIEAFDGASRIWLQKNTDPAFVKQGNSSLKIIRSPAVSQKMDYRAFLHINFPSEYVSMLNLEEYDKDGFKLVFDVYNRYDYTIDFNLKLSSSSGYIDLIKYLRPNEWFSFELPLNAKTNQGISFDWRSMSSMAFMLHEHFGAKEAITYVDNFRVEEV